MSGGVAPWWVPVLQAAEAWGMSPWQVETECSQDWWERYNTYRKAHNKAAEASRKRGGRGA